MSYKVSVLTPVFNVEDYLEQCLDSLVSQTLQEGEIEFIVVNDGSTDSSLEIIERYASRDSRFVVIDKANGGYGTAMNAALQKAKGEYIGILESDDFAEPETFEKLYKAASNHDVDLVKCNFFQHNGALGDFAKENYKQELCDQLFDVADPEWTKVIYATPAIWTGLYKRSFLEQYGIDFRETPGASFQDTGFVFKSWAAAERAFLIHDYLIHYRVNRAGSSVKADAKVFNVCEEWDSIMSFIDALPHRKASIIDFFQAQRLATYRWNYGRIARQYRREFLDRVRSDYKVAFAAGELNPARFSKGNWERLMTLLDDPDALFERDCRKWQLDAPLKVSVIVPVYNTAVYLPELIKSLKKQTLQSIEFILVDDGSSDGSYEVMEKTCKRDSRFRLFHKENGGVGSARNMGLFYAKGTYILFVDSDDLLPAEACENLYRSIKLNSADMAIGVMEEFSSIGKTVYPQTKRMSGMKEISPHDKDFIFTLTLCNKMLKKSIIEDADLGFLDYKIGEDAFFLACYLRYAEKIVGCPHLVYRYRKLLWFQGNTATNEISDASIDAYVDSHSRTGVRFLSNIDERATLLKGESRDVEADLVIADGEYFKENIANRMCGLFVDRYYRNVWRAEDPASLVLKLNAVMDEYWHQLRPIMQRNLQAYFNDIELDGEHFHSAAELIEKPLISVVLIADGASEEFIAKHLAALYRQCLPAFELLMKKQDFELLPLTYKNCLNIRIVPNSIESVGEYLEWTRAPYVNFLDGRVFHSNMSLKTMWRAACSSRADFVSFNTFAFDENEKLIEEPWCGTPFKKPFCEKPSLKHSVNRVDYLLCNKVFKTASLKTDAGLLNGTVKNLAARCYETLSFEKKQARSMFCFEPQARYLAHADSSEAAKLRKHGSVSYADKYQKKRKRLAFCDRVKRKIGRTFTKTDTVLFFTQRNGRRGLSENLRLIYEALDTPNKVVFSEPLPHSAEYENRLKEAIRRAKVIVTDDYCQWISKVRKRSGCKVLQVWHACGAFKKFGLDYPGAHIRNELNMHKGYSLVSVSSDFVRPVYARAFGIPVKKVEALGVPRTDLLLDHALMASKKDAALSKYPELRGKRVILYAPTFRQEGGHQIAWNPKVNWASLSEGLPNDSVILVNPHPLESRSLVLGHFANIIERPELTGLELSAVADCVVTDYSSIVFDFALMDKPFGFYCPDVRTVENDFYLNYPEDFEAPICEEPDSLLGLLQKLEQSTASSNAKFKEKYLGACDGNSTERIVAEINKWLG